jgi:hypothetical protein
MHSWLQHIHALLLAIAFSTDNFTVGFVETMATRYVPTCQSDNDTANNNDRPE